MTTYIIDKHGNVVFLDRVKQPLPSLQISIKCSICNNVFPNRKSLDKHLKKRHPNQKQETANYTVSFNASPTNKPSRSNTTTRTGIGRDNHTTLNTEARDGSKGIGYFAREGGKYGSFPSHDDYGDESFAD